MITRFQIGLILSLACWVAAPGSADAQNEVSARIQALDRQIEKEPRNAELYARRGDLRRAQAEYDAAQADFDRALALNPKLAAALDLARGRLFLDANWPLSAKTALDRFLSQSPDHFEALIYRARALVKLEQRLAAAQDYTRALARANKPPPEVYLERAQSLMGAGAPHYQEALRGIEEGLRRLGPLITLQLYAIDLEVKLKQYDAALARLERVSASSPRKETWLARRGEILRDAGRAGEARQAFQAALAAIAQLPAAHRNTPAVAELEKRLKAALEEPAASRARQE